MNKHFIKNKLHSIIMILCCTIPLIVLAIMYLAKTRETQSSVWSFALILICPLSHLLLMPLLMGKKDKNTGENKPSCH
ncbi:MAG: DUF2933 domain-containing protein [Bacillota bacterium]